jgi:hypothetical protein
MPAFGKENNITGNQILVEQVIPYKYYQLKNQTTKT